MPFQSLFEYDLERDGIFYGCLEIPVLEDIFDRRKGNAGCPQPRCGGALEGIPRRILDPTVGFESSHQQESFHSSIIDTLAKNALVKEEEGFQHRDHVSQSDRTNRVANVYFLGSSPPHENFP